MALLDIYNILFNENDLKKKAIAALFIKATYQKNTSPSESNYCNYVLNNLRTVVDDFWSEVVMNGDVQTSIGTATPPPDATIQYCIDIQWPTKCSKWDATYTRIP